MKITNTKDNRYKVGDVTYEIVLDDGQEIEVTDHYIEMTQPDRHAPSGIRVIGTEIEREYNSEYRIADVIKTDIDELLDDNSN